MTKDNSNGQSYESFQYSDSSQNIYIYLTVRRNDKEEKVLSHKTKITEGNDMNVTTEAVYGENCKITAAGEYVMDTKVNCNGTWCP